MAVKQRISARHALTTQELTFCKVYVAMGASRKNKNEAYRRAFWPEVRDKDTGGMKPNPSMPDQRQIEYRSTALLDAAYIAEFIDELQSDPGDRARQVLVDQVQLADADKDAQKAAEMLLDMEDKVGFRTAAEEWGQIMCAIGAEVVVPLPGEREVSFPFGRMFPQWAGASPPVDAIDKTIASLEALKVTLREQAALLENPTDAPS